MIEKIRAKQRNAPIVKFAGIIVTVIALIVMIIMLASGEDFPLPVAILPVALIYTGIILLIIYFAKYFVFEKNMQMLSKAEKSLEELVTEVENPAKIPSSKIICTEKALVFEKQKWVIPYDSILWMYKNVVKGAYGLVTVETNVIIRTTTGEKFTVKGIQDEAIIWFITKYERRFNENFILGYNAIQYQKYKETVKKNAGK